MKEAFAPEDLALAIPDPRETPVPFGWAETIEPAIQQMGWDELDADDAQLAAFISYLESHDLDCAEFQKARRFIEVRRAELCGPKEEGGRGNRRTHATVYDISKDQLYRIRKIRDWWHRPMGNGQTLREEVYAARKASAVTQARVLKRIDEMTPASVTAMEATAEPALPADVIEDRYQVLFGEFQERLLELPDGSIDLILTDPPYPQDQQDLWSDLAELAAAKLSGRGYLMAMSGKIHLDEIMVRLGVSLRYAWMFCWPLPNNHTRILGRNIRQTWKPILCYTVETYFKREAVPDTLPTSPPEKSLDGWQQSLEPATWLIERFCPPDGLVVDPFLGTGTFGVAALEAGRRFVGVEARSDRFSVAAERLAE